MKNICKISSFNFQVRTIISIAKSSQHLSKNLKINFITPFEWVMNIFPQAID
jgi:hypothetical protein